MSASYTKNSEHSFISPADSKIVHTIPPEQIATIREEFLSSWKVHKSGLAMVTASLHFDSISEAKISSLIDVKKHFARLSKEFLEDESVKSCGDVFQKNFLLVLQQIELRLLTSLICELSHIKGKPSRPMIALQHAQLLEAIDYYGKCVEKLRQDAEKLNKTSVIASLKSFVSYDQNNIAHITSQLTSALAECDRTAPKKVLMQSQSSYVQSLQVMFDKKRDYDDSDISDDENDVVSSIQEKKYGCKEPTAIIRYHSDLKRFIFDFQKRLLNGFPHDISELEDQIFTQFLEVMSKSFNQKMKLSVERHIIRKCLNRVIVELAKKYPPKDLEGYKLVIEWYKLQSMLVEKRKSFRSRSMEMESLESRCHRFQHEAISHNKNINLVAKDINQSEVQLEQLLHLEANLTTWMIRRFEKTHTRLKGTREELLSGVDASRRSIWLADCEDVWTRMGQYQSPCDIDVFYDEGFPKFAEAESKGTFVFGHYKKLLLMNRDIESREKSVGEVKELVGTIESFSKRLQSLAKTAVRGMNLYLYKLLSSEMALDDFINDIQLLPTQRLALDSHLNAMNTQFYALARAYLQHVESKKSAEIDGIRINSYKLHQKENSDMEASLLALLPEVGQIDFEKRKQRLNEEWREYFENYLDQDRRFDLATNKQPLAIAYIPKFLSRKTELEGRLKGQNPEILDILQDVYDRMCENLHEQRSGDHKHIALPVSPRPSDVKRIDLPPRRKSSDAVSVTIHSFSGKDSALPDQKKIPQSVLPQSFKRAPDVPWFTILGKGLLLFLGIGVALTGVGLLFELSLAVSILLAVIVSTIISSIACNHWHSKALKSGSSNEHNANQPEHSTQIHDKIGHKKKREKLIKKDTEYFPPLWRGNKKTVRPDTTNTLNKTNHTSNP